MSQKKKRQIELPEYIQKNLPPARKRRDKKITVRWTDEEYEMLKALSNERNDNITSFVRRLVLGILEQVKEKEIAED